jgi:transposase
MWTTENRHRYDRDRLRYPSDLTDTEWAHIAPLIPPAKRGGGKRTVNMREVVNGVMYVLSTGCQWRYIPKDLPPRSTVNGYFCLWGWDGTLEKMHHALYVKCRELAEREISPTACIVDSQSVKSAEKRLSCLSRVVPTFHDLSWTAAPQGWRVAPPPSAASALTHRVPRQSGF